MHGNPFSVSLEKIWVNRKKFGENIIFHPTYGLSEIVEHVQEKSISPFEKLFYTKKETPYSTVVYFLRISWINFLQNSIR